VKTIAASRPSPTISTKTQVRALLVAIGLLGAAAVSTQGIIEGSKLLQTALGYGDDLTITYIVGGALATFSYIVIAITYLHYRPVAIHAPLRRPTLREMGWIAGGIIVAFGVAILIEAIGAVLGAEGATNFATAAAVGNPMLVYGLLLVGNILLIGPAEELLFRGVIQGRLRESFGPALAIGVISLGFALSHVPSYWIGGSDLFTLGVLFALLGIAAGGLILGTIYERTQNLIVVALIYGLINAVGVGITLVMLL
jgi:membrane protease YdiL (CAAX protease family)